MAEIFRVIQSIPHKELIGCIKPNEPGVVLQLFGNPLV